MEINNKFHHTLYFELDLPAPDEIIGAWKGLKHLCEIGRNLGDNKVIIENIIKYASLDSIKKMEYLEKAEGGMCTGNNSGKQIRFTNGIYGSVERNKEAISFDNILNGKKEKWTYEELSDIGNTFCKYASFLLEREKKKKNCVLHGILK